MRPFAIGLLAVSFLAVGGCSTRAADVDSSNDALTSCTLERQPIGPLSTAISDVTAACSTTGQFCSISRLDVFSTGCATIDQTATAVNALTAFEDQGLDPYPASTFGRDELLKKNYFAFYAPGLLDRIDAAVGSKNVVAYELLAELPCPNCHEFWVRYVLLYPDAGKVVAIDAGYGYDS
jgi:hypothetical protein